VLVESGAAAITIHARTRNEMSNARARWDTVSRGAEIARELCPDDAMRPLIIGNGDVDTPQAARQRALQSRCDGVMIGRGIFGNPWLFSTTQCKAELSLHDVLQAMLEHTETYGRLFSGRKSPELLKKHFKAYLAGFGCTTLRRELMAAQGYAEISALLQAAMSADHGRLEQAEPCSQLG
jgi:tRNA-dihydrouridine synthase